MITALPHIEIGLPKLHDPSRPPTGKRIPRSSSMLAQGSYASAPIEAAMSTGQERFNCLTSALDEVTEGVVLLNSEAQLIWHNRSFDRLLVDNREGHLLVAAVIEFSADFYQDLYIPREASRLEEQAMFSFVRDVTVGRVDHELHCTLMPQGMLGSGSYALCLVKRSASRWSSYEEHLRQTWGLTEREAQVAV